uniref:Uncharacterized protein n=1 Tax=Anopheles atroparvus TaxID=41427 RepID=A0A182JCX0_ANOAO
MIFDIILIILITMISSSSSAVVVLVVLRVTNEDDDANSKNKTMTMAATRATTTIAMVAAVVPIAFSTFQLRSIDHSDSDDGLKQSLPVQPRIRISGVGGVGNGIRDGSFHFSPSPRARKGVAVVPYTYGYCSFPLDSASSFVQRMATKQNERNGTRVVKCFWKVYNFGFTADREILHRVG